MTHPKAPKDLVLAPIAVGIDLNLQRLRDLDQGQIMVELELELDRPSRPSITSDQRKDRILKAALRNVDLHDWDAVIVEDNTRLRLQGGSVSLDLGLSASITRYLEGD